MVKKLNPILVQRWTVRESHEDHWNKEFEQHGIDHLGVVGQEKAT